MTSESTHGNGRMLLRVLLPTEVLVDEPAVKVIAEAENGYFCLEPRHIDFATALVPGVLTFVTPAEQEQYVAVDHGVLVKCGAEVLVSTLNGVPGDELQTLKTLVEERFLELDEHERKARSALARLEAGALRRIRDLQEGSHG